MATDNEHPKIRLRAHVITDVGMVRDHNEDAAYIDENKEFFVVADGMGGHAAGEVASAMAVEAVQKALERSRPRLQQFARAPTDDGRKELVNILETAVRQAHQSVYERGAAETDKQGMGTTLDVVMLAGPEAFVAHVGDSRTYLVRDGRAAQITTDHTVAEVLVIEGKLSLEEAQISPLRTILVNAIGVAPDVGVEMAHVRLRTGDQLLLCSDGLHDYFPLEQELADHMTNAAPEKSLAEMVDIAKNRGGHDNITGVVVEIIEAPTLEARKPRLADAEKTANLGAVSDGVPERVSREDTQPNEREKKRRRQADEETLEFPEAAATARTEEFPAVTPPEPRGGGDLAETARVKTLPPRNPSGQAAAGGDAAERATGSSRKRKRRRRKRKKKKGDGAESDDISRADTLPPYGAKPNPEA